MIFGYARVSTRDQKTAAQHDALTAAGAEQIFTDTISGSIRDRPQLDRMLEMLRKGDVVVVTKFDRLARSIIDLISIVKVIEEKGANLSSLAESLDTRTPAGRLTFHLFACIAEFERARIVERTHEGIAAARRRGRKFGRPKLLSDEQARLALRMIDEENVTLRQVAEQFRISPGTLCTRLKKLRDGGAAHPQQKRA